MKRKLNFVAGAVIAGAAWLYLSSPLLAAPPSHLYGIEKKARSGPEKFWISLNQVGNSERINLHVQKEGNISLTVTLCNASGDIVIEYSIKKKETNFSQNYDFSLAEEGIYNLIVSDGHHRVTRQIKFEQPKTVLSSNFIIN
jgi:hypothetical protein